MKYCIKTIKGNTAYFHYTFKDLKKFLEEGEKYGNVGFIPIRQDEWGTVYKGFGTIEAPNKILRTFYVQHDPTLDNEKIKSQPETTYTFFVWDASNYD